MSILFQYVYVFLIFCIIQQFVVMLSARKYQHTIKALVGYIQSSFAMVN